MVILDISYSHLMLDYDGVKCQVGLINSYFEVCPFGWSPTSFLAKLVHLIKNGVGTYNNAI